ncbi:hypothetical protein MGU_08938 [Metarhizium guizhouense ARSEF 977]|uniref:Uncharacterized protein n=1 Tax=Metarhizium guizhouense (strain ARSEF 977) TaxID=1276136 RepID=A0A0B4GMN2_METGA|nr:hypothetical protein MGU_08938 [Metarhizium guizhouense ARSEF 977]
MQFTFQKMILAGLLAVGATAAPAGKHDANEAKISQGPIFANSLFIQVEGNNDVVKRESNWQSHAKYYAMGGGRGNELYVDGTWSKPHSFTEGTPVGRCTARPLGLYQAPPGSDFQPISDVSCRCWISSNDPIGSKTRCVAGWKETDPADASKMIKFKLRFECSNYFGDCTSFSVLTDEGICESTPTNLCDGFTVTV